MNGVIARMKKDNGYGFITITDANGTPTGEKDVFFHAQSVVDNVYDELNEGDKITFDLEDGPKGPAATNVRRA